MDQADMAEKLITEHLEQVIAAARGIAINTRASRTPVKKCIECNDLIPVKRRRAIPGCTRCVDCEADYESYCRGNKKIRIENDSLDDIYHPVSAL
ncbi:MAG: TraR/DksA C4-type zinc finger protein [Arenicellales bacterium]